MLDLAQAARAAGMSAEGVRVEQLSDCPVPSIIHLRDGHFVAILERRDDRLVVFDDGAERIIPQREIGEWFSGAALLLGRPVDQVNKIPGGSA